MPRTESGIRNFNEESCRWIEFIKCMRSAGMPIEVLIKYVELFKQGKKTAVARRELLIEQRKKLIEKKEDIEKTIERLDYKITVYNDIVAGKRKDFLEEP